MLDVSVARATARRGAHGEMLSRFSPLSLKADSRKDPPSEGRGYLLIEALTAESQNAPR